MRQNGYKNALIESWNTSVDNILKTRSAKENNDAKMKTPAVHADDTPRPSSVKKFEDPKPTVLTIYHCMLILKTRWFLKQSNFLATQIEGILLLMLLSSSLQFCCRWMRTMNSDCNEATQSYFWNSSHVHKNSE